MWKAKTSSGHWLNSWRKLLTEEMEGAEEIHACVPTPPATHTSYSEDPSPLASSLAGGINNNELVSWFPWDLVKLAVMVAFCLVWKGWIISQTHHHPLGASAGRRIGLQGGQGSWPQGEGSRSQCPAMSLMLLLALLPALHVFWTLVRVCGGHPQAALPSPVCDLVQCSEGLSLNSEEFL